MSGIGVPSFSWESRCSCRHDRMAWLATSRTSLLPWSGACCSSEWKGSLVGAAGKKEKWSSMERWFHSKWPKLSERTLLHGDMSDDAARQARGSRLAEQRCCIYRRNSILEAVALAAGQFGRSTTWRCLRCCRGLLTITGLDCRHFLSLRFFVS